MLRHVRAAATFPGTEADALRHVAEKALAAPLDWSRAEVLLEREARRGVACNKGSIGQGGRPSGTAMTDGDFGAAVQHTFAPILAAAAARYQALLAGHDRSDDASALSSATVGAHLAQSSTGPVPAQPPTAVVCFKESLVLDASSAFDDSKHERRLSGLWGSNKTEGLGSM